MAINARVWMFEIELLTPAPPAAAAPAAADLQQTLAAATLAASATTGNAPKAAVVRSLTIEVITRAEPDTCHCVITPQSPPARNLMRRPGRF